MTSVGARKEGLRGRNGSYMAAPEADGNTVGFTVILRNQMLYFMIKDCPIAQTRENVRIPLLARVVGMSSFFFPHPPKMTDLN